MAECKAELADAGRPDLIDQVRRLSLRSDQLGYDVTAPRLDGTTRRMECKGSRLSGPEFRFFLSRGEAERALADPRWSLVACRIDHRDACTVIGWCEGSTVVGLLPDDSESARWQSVEINVQESVF